MIRVYSYHKLIILFFVFIVQLFAPRIHILEVSMSIDIFLIYLTYLSTHNKRSLLVLLGFSFGLAQDIITQHELLGLFALTKTATGFILGSLSLVWPWKKILKSIVVDGEEKILRYHLYFPSITEENTLIAFAFIISGIVVVWVLESFSYKETV